MKRSNTPKGFKGFTGNVPKERVEEGRRVLHCKQGMVYHPTKGWKRQFDSYLHLDTLNSLLENIGLKPIRQV